MSNSSGNNPQPTIKDDGHGIEEESSPSDELPIVTPWDPSKIRVDPKMFSMQNIIDMIDENDLELAPPFQRKEVWKPLQKVRLIESILLRIPLPAFYFSATSDGKYQVVDGLQRLSTVRDFVKNKFPLESGHLEYLRDDVGEKEYASLEGTLWARRIRTTQIFVNIIDPQTPSKVKFDIFKRINTAGSPLNAQEIRHCMSRDTSRNFLKACTSLDSFCEVMGPQFSSHPRMTDREFVLRFVAFSLANPSEYDLAGSMDAFLTEATRKLDEQCTPNGLNNLKTSFDRAITSAWRLFGEYAFRKWPLYEDRKNPINRALFEVWTVELAKYEWHTLEKFRDKIVRESRELMSGDFEFIHAISASTGDTHNVNTRFSRISSLLKEIVK
jgi:hypothetical protein